MDCSPQIRLVRLGSIARRPDACTSAPRSKTNPGRVPSLKLSRPSGWEFREIKPAALQLLADSGSAAIPGMVPSNGGNCHQHADFTRGRRVFALGLDRRHRHPPDVAYPSPLERLSAAPVGYRRLSGAMVRGLSGAEPLHGVRRLSP